jgi:cytochrome c oxidase subunit 3
MHAAPRLASKTPFADPQESQSAGRFGMVLFLISLGVLFAATVVGLVVIRVQLAQKDLWPNDLPGLPVTLWIGTLVIIASGATMQWALVAVRTDQRKTLRLALNLTTALGVAFLVIQAGSWWWWSSAVADRWHESETFRLALTGFYVLSGLHALHVIGGIAALIVTTLRAIRRRYSSHGYAGVRYCAMYWHFLDAVWLVLFALLLIGM